MFIVLMYSHFSMLQLTLKLGDGLGIGMGMGAAIGGDGIDCCGDGTGREGMTVA